MAKGTLTQNGVHLEEHEWKTVKYFLDLGKNIELLPKSEIKDYHQGDFMMDSIPWEAKAPVGNGKYTVQNKIQEAAQQSCNIIIDLRRSKMLEEKAVRTYEREFMKSKGLRRMKIIKKDGELIDFHK